MRKDNLLLIVDPQNDFCLPTGALYVKNAEKDMQYLANFIENNYTAINQIIVSLDTHHVINISHPCFWEYVDHPYYQGDFAQIEPYTQISYRDIEEGKISPRYNGEKATEYLLQLEKQGEFPHTVWPEHCIVGSTGAAIVDVLMDKLKKWEKIQNTHFQVVEKGLNSMTEMFGIFRANVPDASDKRTMENMTLINLLSAFNRIIIAGEAKSHCIANSVRQLFEYPDIMKKLILFDDCMSDVEGFEYIAEPIYEKAKEMGVQFCKSTEFKS